MDSKLRSFLKATTWRILVTFTVFLSAKISGVNNRDSIKLVLIMNIINMILYYFHERVWNKLRRRTIQ